MKALGTTMMLASAVVFLTALFLLTAGHFSLLWVILLIDHCPVCFYGGYPVRYRVWSGIFAN